jgi:lipid-binding SYLF domain-containing protein
MTARTPTGRRSALRAIAATTLAGPLALAACANQPPATEAQQVVDQSRIALQQMLSAAGLEALPRYIITARAVMIVPELLRGGFILGGRYGQGVVLARLPDGSWSYPAFYSSSGGTIGLQIGGQLSQFVLTIMTQKGLDALQRNDFTLGADVSAAIATVGAGVGAQTGLDTNADMYAFALNQGLFAGGTVDGTVISELDRLNDAYYGFGTPARLVFEGQKRNPGADGLLAVLPR